MTLAVFITIFLALAGGKQVVNSANAGFLKSSGGSSDVSSVVDTATDKITSGDFAGADELISKIKNVSDTRASQLGRIIEEYKKFSQERQEAKAKLYKEMLADLKGEGPKDSEKDKDKDKEKVKDKVKDNSESETKGDTEKESEDVTDDDPEAIDEEDEVDPEAKEINETFLKILKVQEYANEEQEEELLSSELAASLFERALKRAGEYESKGEWLEAYTNCYYWLSSLFPDNQEYKDQGERLTRLVMIEMSLKDNSCEKSADRHAGIKPEMLVRAVRALDFSYVSLLDYKEMTKKAIEQCRCLGQVLYEEKEDIPYKVSISDMDKWKVGLKSIEEGLEGDPNEPVVVKRDDFVRIFTDVLVLNATTLAIPEEIIVSQYTEASLEALDPFTNLIWPWQVLDFQKNMTQDFTGIGVHITKIRGVLAVASLLPDTPAYHSNLDANDEILAVNGESTKDMTLTCVVSKITGPKGTKVTLTVRHEDAPKGETEDITLVRARIEVPTIRGWVRDTEGESESGSSEVSSSAKENSGKWVI